MLAPAALLRRNSYEVESMATAADKGQLLVLRNLLMQYCMIPMFEVMDTCSDASFANYHHLMRSNADIFRAHHQSLYLGSSGIEGFADQRLKVGGMWAPVKQGGAGVGVANACVQPVVQFANHTARGAPAIYRSTLVPVHHLPAQLQQQRLSHQGMQRHPWRVAMAQLSPPCLFLNCACDRPTGPAASCRR
jgi:hypothetical protein